ncbi:MAG TPA: glycosyltransferase, partial [Thermodesulfobacteriota bacterium]|nr:glycosyltransferase [Thermodesulfobacteriota bacterium]
LGVVYCVEPEQNIALARNLAVENAAGDYIAFIDDDEIPADNWLLVLYRACRAFGVDGVLGPVLPRFEAPPPRWITRGRIFDRPFAPTGTILSRNRTRTGNVLLKKSIFDPPGHRFRKEFGMGGEDRDFFGRMIEKGHRFAWCQEALVYESIPPERMKRGFLLRRALLRGRIPQFRPADILMSFLAVPLYALVIPYFFFTAHHIFMKLMISEFDHLGRLLCFFGVRVTRQNYIFR